MISYVHGFMVRDDGKLLGRVTGYPFASSPHGCPLMITHHQHTPLSME